MALGHISGKSILASLVSSMLYMTSAIAVPHIDYASPMGDEQWKMSGNPLRCGLSLVIPNYGIGYFEQYATKPPHFILRKWDQVQRSLPAQVLAKPPVWKPLLLNSYVVARSYIKPGEYGIYLNREPALKLLIFLSQGYQANFNYLSEEGFSVTVSLSPIRFQKVYSKYQQCLGGLLPFNYDDVKDTVFHFGIDSKLLTDEDKSQLRRIAQYVAADMQIDVIRIVGYADESGRKGYNNAVSQFRAEAVKNYLLWLGVPKRKLSVTWFGAQKPIARNDTDEGRAANRRVVIELIKK
ncbi:sodium-type flagellar protein [Legionella quateirensis]|uniref:Sodium-type flagellar protein n=2 Tax=Legionella quateirensis TaxID=45072 RepID=A0A378L0V5_9GAMM|nr:OmpA family protein [Legionella quateirensis]KTD44906.1 sodium-type flagellar protein [Legionella quateirensis]STY19471.1 sodium-type flagellar protein [Legionella quateirensis]